MKKIRIILMLALLAFLAAGCGEKKSSVIEETGALEPGWIYLY